MRRPGDWLRDAGWTYDHTMTGYLLMRGVDERSFVVLEEFDGGLVDSGYRIEIERDDAFHLSHADGIDISDAVYGLGGFVLTEIAVAALAKWRTAN